MENFDPEQLIPEQQSGAQSNTQAHKELPDENTARLFYIKICERLLHVNEWKSYSENYSADFQLCDATGKPVSRIVQIGDHLRIDGPGPGSITGEGYDWVRVEDMDKQEGIHEEFLMIRVRPVPNPLNNKKDTAHFFSEDSTSTFIIRRDHNTVHAEVHGRNETVNTGADALFDKARNIVAGAVAVTVYSKIQWQGLAEGLLSFSLEDH